MKLTFALCLWPCPPPPPFSAFQVALSRFQRFFELPEGGALPLIADSASDTGVRIKGDFSWDREAGSPTLRGLDITVCTNILSSLVVGR